MSTDIPVCVKPNCSQTATHPTQPGDVMIDFLTSQNRFADSTPAAGLATIPSMNSEASQTHIDPDSKPKIVAVMPAYNAAATIEQTLRDIPTGTVDEVILV